VVSLAGALTSASGATGSVDEEPSASLSVLTRFFFKFFISPDALLSSPTNCLRRWFSYRRALISSLRLESSAFLRFLDLRALLRFFKSLYSLRGRTFLKEYISWSVIRSMSMRRPPTSTMLGSFDLLAGAPFGIGMIAGVSAFAYARGRFLPTSSSSSSKEELSPPSLLSSKSSSSSCSVSSI